MNQVPQRTESEQTDEGAVRSFAHTRLEQAIAAIASSSHQMNEPDLAMLNKAWREEADRVFASQMERVRNKRSMRGT